MGGSLQTVPTQAMVIKFAFSPDCVPPQLTNTTGTGDKIGNGFRDTLS
jgi:hypothetical protein